MDYDQFTDEDWNKEFAHLQDKKAEINPVILNQIINQQEEIERLRQQVQEFQDELKIEEQRFSDQWEILAACQAREAKLRDELSGITGWLEQGVCLSDNEWTAYEHEVNWNRAIQAKYQSAMSVLALPPYDTAMKEYRKRVLLDVADWFESGKCVSTAELRRMADED